MKQLLPVAVCLLLASCSSSSHPQAAQPEPSPAPLADGANYDWFASSTPCVAAQADQYLLAPTILPGQTMACLAPYSVIVNYDVQQALIDAQLETYNRAGVHSMKLVIWHVRGSDWHGQYFFNTYSNGAADCASNRQWIMDSSGGTLPPACQKNLENLLLSLKSHGFTEVMLDMGPEGNNWWYGGDNPGFSTPNLYTDPNLPAWPGGWSGKPAYESYFAENLGVVQTVYNLAASSGVAFDLDLKNEGVSPTAPGGLEYARRMWAAYVGVYGTLNTIGFSMMNDPAEVGALNGIYAGRPPQNLDLHVYPAEDTTAAATSALSPMLQSLSAAGYKQPLSISETYTGAQNIIPAFRAAAQNNGISLRFVAAWPLTIQQQYLVP